MQGLTYDPATDFFLKKEKLNYGEDIYSQVFKKVWPWKLIQKNHLTTFYLL